MNNLNDNKYKQMKLEKRLKAFVSSVSVTGNIIKEQPYYSRNLIVFEYRDQTKRVDKDEPIFV